MESCSGFGTTPGTDNPGIEIMGEKSTIFVTPEDFPGLFMVMTTHMRSLDWECIRVGLAQYDARKKNG